MMQQSQISKIESEKKIEKKATIVDRYVNDGKTRYIAILSDMFRFELQFYYLYHIFFFFHITILVV